MINILQFLRTIPLFEYLIEEASAEFRSRYRTDPKIVVCAPGRVNLIGEHTDYNDGFVFPLAIQRYTVIVAEPIDGELGHVYSTNAGQEARLLCSGPIQPDENVTWVSYVQGTIACCLEKGVTIPGFRAVVHSNVPLGGGLSSSASLEVAVATLIQSLAGQIFDPVTTALLCQKAEHEFARMPCGIMDQFISALAQENHAMLLDCRSYVPTMVPLADPNVVVLIANSNVKHSLTGSEYPQRRMACEEASKILGVAKLRDGDMSMLLQKRDQLGEVVFRRARHVIEENNRTILMAKALIEANWNEVGRLMYASHDSLRDDYEVSCPELDTLVELARRASDEFGVIGSRMTGGGFGGCTVSLVKAEQATGFSQYLSKAYQTRTGIKPTLFTTRPSRGACRFL